jgi:hypothetical protein
MLGWIEQGAAGELRLLASIFFRSHNGELWQETLEEFRRRKQRAACCHSHAKVVTLAFASGVRRQIVDTMDAAESLTYLPTVRAAVQAVQGQAKGGPRRRRNQPDPTDAAAMLSGKQASRNG